MAPSPTSPAYQSLQNHLGDLAEEVVDLTANRGAFSQSLNIHLQSPTVGQLTSMARRRALRPACTICALVLRRKQ
ncbi:uncharacterized protein HD556DRAFT_1394925 [Suillus plorans]|uniref:Uncharacterized protein n=1 Tax=Suillus plorans TaxID=116603 RepID=A0A9P7AI23_9AGAM|nr:uncharacterized protein HD556DRAFT_1394925 [Suillus plorans]KAG1789997.1 hypothetical protein HD556DRAFT_1394925 [Suillus plorans]